ncbi:hypothetical protein PN480_17500 [Dolichospermum circinale CS-1225]|uniref:Transposase n=1 Tax=Dolichospermum circinale CS-537/01 TaxID=3021739 RepID=A0ABT5A7E9_9CYAN|nr:hypothetical protein [Dolichospermum circinale]MDB9459001.1 hypothetical protein [Dolichospermum circinale CS-545/17]MDB9466751.1 hypothetical protein [Dolichospermum circinale CS-539/09]MDB9472698.1 hypothetical protein [Dolichospermum circinale CS-539]MDB9487884.1 hypothetical protein [Dolichospermum circinale CS-537/01]MDB9523727.1 hypothetical protein [Dolichospermum circinale CS-1225]
MERLYTQKTSRIYAAPFKYIRHLVKIKCPEHQNLSEEIFPDVYVVGSIC